MCVRVFSVLCCSVQVEALRRADPPSEESYQLSNRFISSEVKILNRNRPFAYTLKDYDDDDIRGNLIT
jgi:hypothetical protein